VKRYVAAVKAEGVGANTVRLAVAPVRALFATALEEGGLIRSNPCAGVRVSQAAPVEEDGERAKALTDAELRTLIAETAPEWRLLVEFLAATGLRISEAVALRWQDFDLGRRRVLVRRRFYRGAFAPP
jgi:integrase